jgi:ribosomal protein S18 acetylase RimI-like enzyme
MSDDVRVEEAGAVSEALAEQLNALIPQLSSSAPALAREAWQEIADAGATHLLVAHDPDGRAIGMLTLALFSIPTGVRAWIEDVVVDERARGRGVGEQLTAEAIRIAAGRGARTVDLTSRPSREAANRLYRRMGFAARETNVYRHSGAD